MAIKLYQERNPQIQGVGVIQPQRSTIGTQIASGLSTYANKIQKAAEDNFALGKAQVINDITTQAYEIAPDDVAKFNELVESGLQKSFKGLDEATQTKIRASINTKLDSIKHKIVQNKLNRLDKENKENVIVHMVLKASFHYQDAPHDLISSKTNLYKISLEKIDDNWKIADISSDSDLQYMALTEEFGQEDMDNNLITEKEIRKYAQEQVETVEKYLEETEKKCAENKYEPICCFVK